MAWRASAAAFDVQAAANLRGADKRRLVVAQDHLVDAYEDGEEICQNWDLEVLWWSWLISALGAYVAFTTTMYIKRVRGTRWYWLFLAQAGLAIGVCAVWCMHFVGMRALVLQSEGKPEVTISFEPVLSVVSALAAWLICCIALHVILVERKGHNMNNDEPVTRHYTTTSIHRATELFSREIKMLPWLRLILATALVASGVVVMHYMGMVSQTGTFTMKLNPWPVTASVFLAFLAAGVTLPIFATEFDNMLWRCICAAGVGIGVNGMHYTGMSSATYHFHSYTGIWGENTVAWHFYYKDVVAFALFLNLVLMGVAGFYVEVAREFIRYEELEIEERLKFERHKANVKNLIRQSRQMRYPFALVQYRNFTHMKKLTRHETLRDTRKLKYLDTIKDVQRLKRDHPIVFFSHQWLAHGVPDPGNVHYNAMLTSMPALGQVFGMSVESFYMFVDYCSIPQEGAEVQQLAIDSLSTYVSLSSAIVIVAPQAEHAQTGMECNFETYSERFWCRLEIFCTILSSLRNKSGDRALSMRESEEDTDLHQQSDEVSAVSPIERSEVLVAPNMSYAHSTATAELAMGVRNSVETPTRARNSLQHPSQAIGKTQSGNSRGSSSDAVRGVRSDRKQRRVHTSPENSRDRGHHEEVAADIVVSRDPTCLTTPSVIVTPISKVAKSHSSSSGGSRRSRSATHRTITHRTTNGHTGSTGSDDAGGGLVYERQRVFLTQGEGLTRVRFFTKDKQLREKFKPLINVYGGRTSCCDLGHPWEDAVCDRKRVVNSLTGAYGAMLQDLRRMKRKNKRGLLGMHASEDLSRNGQVKLVEEIAMMSNKLLPREYFDSRIDAVHSFFYIQRRASVETDEPPIGDDKSRSPRPPTMPQDTMRRSSTEHKVGSCSTEEEPAAFDGEAVVFDDNEDEDGEGGSSQSSEETNSDDQGGEQDARAAADRADVQRAGSRDMWRSELSALHPASDEASCSDTVRMWGTQESAT